LRQHEAGGKDAVGERVLLELCGAAAASMVTVVRPDGAHSIVPGFGGYTRTNLPFWTWRT
jgi:hypothetical protein